jgi:hypothetical protein
MKSKVIISTLVCCLCCISTTLLAVNKKQLYSVQDFIDNINQKATLQKQKNTENLREFNAKIKKLQYQQPTQESQQATNTLKQLKQANSTPIINCNDPNNPNNFPSNYFYNHQQQRIYQKQPFAKCQPIITTPTITSPVAIPTATQQQQKQQEKTAAPTLPVANQPKSGSTGSQTWDINY